MTSKFSRNPATAAATSEGGARPNPAPASAPTPASAPAASGELGAQFSALQAKASALRERRVRLTVQQEHVQREIEDCQAQARELGVSSLEELEQLVARMEAEERQKLSDYSAALTQEEQRLNQVEGDLARLDQRS